MCGLGLGWKRQRGKREKRGRGTNNLFLSFYSSQRISPKNMQTIAYHSRSYFKRLRNPNYDSDDSDALGTLDEVKGEEEESETDEEEEEPKPKPNKKAKTVVAPETKTKKKQTNKSDESKQSQYPGVYWDKKAAKWTGSTCDVLADRSKSKAKRNYAKKVYTKYFDDDFECYQALQALKKQIDEKNNAIWAEQASNDPLTSNVEKAPDDICDAEKGVAYWMPHRSNNQLPTRMVVKEDKSKKKTGFVWMLCCQHTCDSTGLGDCSTMAHSFEKGQPVQYCNAHTEAKAYACNVQGCDFTCKTETHLKEHKRCVHEGELYNPCKSKTGHDGKCPYEVSGASKHDGYCTRCFISHFPNDPRAVNAKAYLHAKELTVREFLKETFPHYRWVFDRTCAVGELVRPDARTAIGKTRILIVEVDEDSHNTYSCANERERERIFKKHAPRGAVVHVVRFNPDAYDDPATGKRIPTCFIYSKEMGKASIPDTRKQNWEFRLSKLQSTIQEIIDNQHEDIQVPELLLDEEKYKYVIPIELFYDNVIAKWPNGNKQKLAALKRNAQIRKATTAAATAASASDSNSNSDDECDYDE